MYYYEMSHRRGQFDSNYTLLASNYMNNVHQINTIRSKLHPTFTTILSAIVKYNNGRVTLQWFVCDKHLIIKNAQFNTILGDNNCMEVFGSVLFSVKGFYLLRIYEAISIKCFTPDLCTQKEFVLDLTLPWL